MSVNVKRHGQRPVLVANGSSGSVHDAGDRVHAALQLVVELPPLPLLHVLLPVDGLKAEPTRHQLATCLF